MILGYKQKLFTYIFIIFAIFTAGIVVFEQTREVKFKTEALKEKLEAYADMLQIELKDNIEQKLDSVIKYLPEDIRVTLIDKNGKVTYDNEIQVVNLQENHFNRPEIVDAKKYGDGIHHRLSTTNQKEYLYYAKKFTYYYIRVALPYNIQTQNFLKANNLFIYFILALFLTMLFLIHKIIESFGKSVKQFKDHRYRQEITGNIAHELRTPVTSIRGFLETVLEKQLDSEKEHYFIKQAYNQTIVLSELIRDMSLITKMEDAPAAFHLKSVCINDLLKELKTDLQLVLQERKITMEWDIPDNLIIHGNQNLLYSIFRNLTDNVIHYAGENVNILITGYIEKQYCYFSFSDDGKGISDEKHLNRIFERFYRINEGRTRDTGGTGLGLSIVKNAVLFHKGNIVAKNRENGGLEFLFSVAKSI